MALTGCKALLEADPAYHRDVYPNICNYLAAPNIVNTAHEHVGRVYRVYVPYTPREWSISTTVRAASHAVRSLGASGTRAGSYFLTGISIFGSGGAAAPAIAAGTLSVLNILNAGSSAASIYGLGVIIGKGDDFKRQHSIENIREAIADEDHPPVLMRSWPKLAELRWTTFTTGLRALAPFPATSPGVRNIFNESKMIDAQVRNLSGYEEDDSNELVGDPAPRA